eukprot:TRINITY_DN22468_c0_g1_i1.p1 TRINITY_DN22468_c0_g1~~TRINITY_DN22468_c0_g1_i1.p1  ORF type:complete len:255 (+),score=75.15 TRINITY_DN22468_c0_g1_i1:64-828(+)
MKAAMMLAAMAATSHASDIVIAGDSWGTEGRKAFLQMLKDHKSNLTVDDIAVSGSTTSNWVDNRYTEKLEKAVKQDDVKVVWLTLMGNDAKNELPVCGAEGEKPAKCVERVVNKVTPNMQKILDTIHTSNPKTRVVGFGYDVMGFGIDNGACHLLPGIMFPSCGDKNATCFNENFLALQTVWNGLGQRNEFVDVLDLAGSIQAGAGDKNASCGHPDLSEWSPAKYMQSNCIHPNDAGFGFIFSNMWDLYLHKFN